MNLEERIAALEQTVAALAPPHRPLRPASGATTSVGDEETFWLLQQLRERHPDGAVIFGGMARVGKGEVAWQWGVPSDQLAEQDWSPAAPVLDALGHPVRLRLLQQVINGATGTAELAEDPTLGTTGQLHHHLRALVAAGWLTSTGRGQWTVPAPRAIPLLAVIAATLA